MNDQGSHISTLQLHHSRVAWQNWFLSNLISHEISILSLRYRHDLPKGWADMWHIWIKGETQDIPRPLAGHKEIEILEEYLASPDPNVKLEEDAGHLSWRPAGDPPMDAEQEIHGILVFLPPDLGFGMEHCKISLIRRQSKIFSKRKNNSWVILQGPGQKNSQKLRNLPKKIGRDGYMPYMQQNSWDRHWIPNRIAIRVRWCERRQVKGPQGAQPVAAHWWNPSSLAENEIYLWLFNIANDNSHL